MDYKEALAKITEGHMELGKAVSAHVAKIEYDLLLATTKNNLYELLGLIETGRHDDPRAKELALWLQTNVNNTLPSELVELSNNLVLIILDD